jgi:hypothetical protein
MRFEETKIETKIETNNDIKRLPEKKKKIELLFSNYNCEYTEDEIDFGNLVGQEI